MAVTTREQVMTALLAQLQGNVPGIQTYSRRVFLPSEVKAKLTLPALMLYRLRETHEHPADALPPRRKWPVYVIVVFQNLNKSVAGDTIINPIMDGIEAALKPSGPSFASIGTQTLGGLVQWVKIEGDVHIEPGDTDPNGVGGLVVPLTILLP